MAEPTDLGRHELDEPVADGVAAPVAADAGR
jgi:hypothetical protein